MNPPLILVESDDLGMFSSSEALTLKLEPWYVRDETFAVFDRCGRAVELGIELREKSSGTGLVKGETECVTVESAEVQPRHQGELRSALIGGLVAAFNEETEILEPLSLVELVDLAVERFGFDD